jgi:small subunit ribosomal protein S4
MGENNLWGAVQSPRQSPWSDPGPAHGQRRKGKVSDFGLQLLPNGKAEGYSTTLTEQFRRIYTEAERVRATPARTVGLLERRLDAVVYRAKVRPDCLCCVSS